MLAVRPFPVRSPGLCLVGADRVGDLGPRRASLDCLVDACWVAVVPGYAPRRAPGSPGARWRSVAGACWRLRACAAHRCRGPSAWRRTGRAARGWSVPRTARACRKCFGNRPAPPSTLSRGVRWLDRGHLRWSSRLRAWRSPGPCPGSCPPRSLPGLSAGSCLGLDAFTGRVCGGLRGWPVRDDAVDGVLEPGGEAFVGAGRIEAVLAGSAGLVRAVGTGRRAVSLVVGGLIERGQDDWHPGAGDRLRVAWLLPAWPAPGWPGWVRASDEVAPAGTSWVPS